MTIATCCADCLDSGTDTPCAGARTGAEPYYWFDLWVGTSWVGAIRATERTIGVIGSDLTRQRAGWSITTRQ